MDEVIESPLNGSYSDDGLTVDIKICRTTAKDWSLEIIDAKGSSVVWNNLFKSDEDAWSEFIDEVETEGLHTLLSDVAD